MKNYFSFLFFSLIKMIKIRNAVFSIVLMLFIPFITSAQNSDIQKKFLHFQYYNVENGLSQGTIYCMFQDSRGFLWLGTQNGLNRYDGYSFKHFNNDTADSLSISSNFILSIAEDKLGNLWVATENGLNMYDYDQNIFKRYLMDSTGMSIVQTVYVDKSGIIWVGTKSKGLFRVLIDSSKAGKIIFTNYRHNPGNKYSLSSNLVRRIFEDSKGRIWVGTARGLNLFADYKKGIFKRIVNINNENRKIESQVWTIFESKSGKIFFGSTAGTFSVYKDLNNSYSLIDLSKQNKFSSTSTSVISACLDNSGNLWIGRYGGGLFLWDEKNSQLMQVLDINKKNDLATETIYSIIVDRSNVIWVGTQTGLLKWAPNYSYFDGYKYRGAEKESSSEDLTLAFCEDSQKKIWVGTVSGLEIFNPVKKIFEEFNLEDYLEGSHNDNAVKSLYQDKNGIYWIGTSWKGLFEMVRERDQNKNYKLNQYWFKHNINPDVYDNSALKIVEDKFGYLWIATKYGIKSFDKTKKEFHDLTFTSNSKVKLPHEIIFDIYNSQIDKDIFWVGTRDDGLYELALGNNANEVTGLKHFVPEPGNENSLNSRFVRTILEDKKGRIWIGTIGGGLNLLNKDSSTFSHFGVKEGLPSKVIIGILQDDLGYLWLSTFSGLCRFDPEIFEVINFNKSDGLQNIEYNGGASLKSKSGDLYFGGTNGFDIVHPELVEKNKILPPVVITGVQLYNQSILNRIQKDKNIDALHRGNDYGSIELSYSENVLSFEFSALDFISPVNNKYAYMMEGIDTSWNFVASRRFANYSKIPPGEYLFKVKAANNNGVWNNEGAFLKIIITPPFWQTWWFRTLTLLILITILVILYKNRVKNIEKKKRTLELQVKERTEAAQKIQDAYSQIEKLKNELEAENIYLQDEIKLTHNFESIISTSESFKKILYQVEKVSSTDAIVLILGESGTGKELLARAIHSLSSRKNRPLIKVNCAALPSNLIESELFGHEKGAFTGAYAKKIGRFELANGGTIFLDEIGDLPLELQTKLLRVLQENEFERVGGTTPIQVDVRVIAATNRDLETALKQGTFREDLYYRLNVFPIKIPPLRERKEDIPVLVNHFINKHCMKVGKKIESIPPKIMNKLIEYDWPGNVRELENVIERAIIISPGNSLKFEDAFLKNKVNGTIGSFQSLDEFERKYIIEVLESTNWRVSGPNGAAKILGLVPSTLEFRMKKLNIFRK